MMTIQKDNTNKSVSLNISGSFDYSCYQDFRKIYRYEEQQGIFFRINLSKVTYMDSSGLGMILLLKEHTDKLSGKVIVEHPTDPVLKVLSLAKFEQHITIVH